MRIAALSMLLLAACGATPETPPDDEPQVGTIRLRVVNDTAWTVLFILEGGGASGNASLGPRGEQDMPAGVEGPVGVPVQMKVTVARGDFTWRTATVTLMPLSAPFVCEFRAGEDEERLTITTHCGPL